MSYAWESGFDPNYEPEEGQLVHVSWAKAGCVWRVDEIMDEDRVWLVTPKTGKRMMALKKDLLHIRGKNSYRHAAKRDRLLREEELT